MERQVTVTLSVRQVVHLMTVCGMYQQTCRTWLKQARDVDNAKDVEFFEGEIAAMQELDRTLSRA